MFALKLFKHRIPKGIKIKVFTSHLLVFVQINKSPKNFYLKLTLFFFLKFLLRFSLPLVVSP